MSPIEMTVAIVAIVAVVSIIRAKYKYGIVTRWHGGEDVVSRGPDPDAERLREEVRQLKERVAVLERLATDTDRAVALDREIDKLRSGQ